MIILSSTKLPPEKEAEHCRQKIKSLSLCVGNDAKVDGYRLRLAELKAKNPQLPLPFYCPEHQFTPEANCGFAFCPRCEAAEETVLERACV